MPYQNLQIYTDGASRGNPGPAGIGVAIWQGNILVDKISQYIGQTTNNQAEYEAIIAGLKKAKKLGAEVVEIFSDSELVTQQLARKYKVKDKNLGPLFVKVWNLSLGFKKVNFHYIPRQENKAADKLANQTIDKFLKTRLTQLA